MADGHMKASVTSLLDCSIGIAGPPAVRTARRSVKSDNERDPHLYLLPCSQEQAHYRETAGVNPEEGAGNDRSVCPECPGLHARYKGRDNGKPGREAELTRNPFIVRIEGCNSPS